jgi:cation diffusion facilitator family transporter
MAIYAFVWLITGSLAALAELAHTLVDAIAVTVTVFAVKTSRKPPDVEHPYGHYKADTLGGLFGSVIVLIAAALIAYEAVERLLAWEPFTPDLFAAVAVVAAIAIDLNRVSILRRFKRSKALSADALHFTTDIFASAAVLVDFVIAMALASISYSLFREISPLVDVAMAAAITAIFASLSFRLLKASAIELLDYSPPDVVQEVEKVARGINGVVGVKDIRVRKAGEIYHGELTIEVPRGLSVEEAHEIADEVEKRVKEMLGGVVTVHVEPTS